MSSYLTGFSEKRKRRSSWKSLLIITVILLVIFAVSIVSLSIWGQDKPCMRSASCPNKKAQNCCVGSKPEPLTIEKKECLKNGKEEYPCNNCYQPFSYYGGLKEGVTPEPMEDCRLDRQNQIYTKCRGVDIFGVLL